MGKNERKVQKTTRFRFRAGLAKIGEKVEVDRLKRYPDAYVEYLVHFHGDRDFFECHEIMEEFWKKDPSHPHGKTYVGLIQVAVGLYHQRRGNTAGAIKMLRSSLANMQRDCLRELGLDASALVRLVESRAAELERDPGQAYADLDLPIADPDLAEQCRQKCGEGWLKPSDLRNDQLVHRHTLRDRTGVVRERLASREEKRRKRREGSSEAPAADQERRQGEEGA
jgi:predicted metal-dependent hydrolase